MTLYIFFWFYFAWTVEERSWILFFFTSIFNRKSCDGGKVNNTNSNNNNISKMIHREMCKKFKFDHTNKWHMHNPASVLENDTHKLLWDFHVQMDYLI